MARLERIAIGGFKSIKDLQSLELRSVNVFVGANGSGKSNLVSFFRLLGAIAAENLQEFVGRAGGPERLLYYGSKETPAMWASLDFGCKTGPGNYFFGLTATATDTLIFSREQVIYRKTKNSSATPLQLGSGHKESLLKNDFPELSEALAGIQIFHFHDTSESSPMRKHGYIEDNLYLKSDAGNLAAFLYKLKQRQHQYYSRIKETVRQIAPFFDDFVLAPSVIRENDILLNWKDCDSEHLFGPDQLSDGTLRAMALIALLLQPEDELPGLIVLDEPEIGLHPYAIEIVAALIRSASVHRPVVVATQSVALVNYFEPEDVIVVSRGHSQSRFQRQNSKSLEAWLREYGIGDLWEKNLIGGTPSR